MCNKLFRLMPLLVAALLTSCLGESSSDLTTTQSISEAWAVAVDEATGEQSLINSLSYNIEYNYSNNQTTVKISGLKLPGGTEYPTITVGPVPFTVQDQTWKVVTLNGYVGEVGSYGSKPNFLSFDFRFEDYYVDDTTYVPAFWMSFSLDGYTVYSGLGVMMVNGTATCVSPSGQEYVDESVTIGANISLSKGTATIGFSGVTFAPEMESAYPQGVEVMLSDVSVAFAAGEMNFSAKSIVPVANKTSYEKYTVTNLRGTANALSGITIEFDCTVDGATYLVRLTGKY